MAAIPLPQNDHRPRPSAPAEHKPNLRVVTRSKPKRRSQVLPRLIGFSVIAFSAFMASSLVGNVALENCRQQGKFAARRTISVREHQSALQRQVIALSSAHAIERWAYANGFVPSERLSVPSEKKSYVAFNR